MIQTDQIALSPKDKKDNGLKSLFIIIRQYLFSEINLFTKPCKSK